MEYNFDPEDLMKEKSLWDIYVLSLHVKSSKFNKSIIAICIICLSIYAYIFQKNSSTLLEEIRSLSILALNISITVLGFLIAGFTIFATLSKPAMLLRMMDFKHEESGLPYLKYNFFAFIRVFIYYIAIIFLYVLVILLGSKNGMVSVIVGYLPMASLVKDIIIKITYVTLGTSIVFLILLLKTFIFNIYTIVMNQLRWELLNDKDEEAK